MLLLLASLLAAAPGQAAAPVVFDFEADTAATGWTAGGPAATLAVTHDAAQVHHGQGALLCSYTGTPGAPFSLSRSDLDLTGARSLALSLNASAQTPFVLTLAEKTGAQYQLFVTCLPNEWCDLNVPLTDFQLDEHSIDLDSRLDPEQVTTLTLQSLANLPGDMGEILGTQTGPQRLLVDDLAFRTTEAPSRSLREPGKVVVDRFTLPALCLLPVGGAAIARAPARPPAPAGVSVRFTFAANGPRAWPGLVIPVGHLDLKAAKAMRLRMNSVGPLRFHVLAEERGGARYEGQAELPRGGEWLAKDLPLADFKLQPGYADDDGRLDPGELRVIVVVADVYNALLDEKAQSEFTVGEVLFLEP